MQVKPRPEVKQTLPALNSKGDGVFVDEDTIHEVDRAFFEVNPSRRLYVRRSVGFQEAEKANATLVIKLNPKVRLRVPFEIPRINNRLVREANEDETGMLEAFARTYPDIRSMLRNSPHFWRTMN